MTFQETLNRAYVDEATKKLIEAEKAENEAVLTLGPALASVNVLSVPNVSGPYVPLVNADGGGDLNAANYITKNALVMDVLSDESGDARDNLGLGSAAVADTGDFATSAQGSAADSALQPGDPTVRTAAGVPNGAPTGTELPIAFDTTAVSGGIYVWITNAWVKMAVIPGA